MNKIRSLIFGLATVWCSINYVSASKDESTILADQDSKKIVVLILNIDDTLDTISLWYKGGIIPDRNSGIDKEKINAEIAELFRFEFDLTQENCDALRNNLPKGTRVKMLKQLENISDVLYNFLLFNFSQKMKSDFKKELEKKILALNISNPISRENFFTCCLKVINDCFMTLKGVVSDSIPTLISDRQGQNPEYTESSRKNTVTNAASLLSTIICREINEKKNWAANRLAEVAGTTKNQLLLRKNLETFISLMEKTKKFVEEKFLEAKKPGDILSLYFRWARTNSVDGRCVTLREALRDNKSELSLNKVLTTNLYLSDFLFYYGKKEVRFPYTCCHDIVGYLNGSQRAIEVFASIPLNPISNAAKNFDDLCDGYKFVGDAAPHFICTLAEDRKKAVFQVLHSKKSTQEVSPIVGKNTCPRNALDSFFSIFRSKKPTQQPTNQAVVSISALEQEISNARQRLQKITDFKKFGRDEARLSDTLTKAEIVAQTSKELSKELSKVSVETKAPCIKDNSLEKEIEKRCNTLCNLLKKVFRKNFFLLPQIDQYELVLFEFSVANFCTYVMVNYEFQKIYESQKIIEKKIDQQGAAGKDALSEIVCFLRKEF